MGKKHKPKSTSANMTAAEHSAVISGVAGFAYATFARNGTLWYATPLHERTARRTRFYWRETIYGGCSPWPCPWRVHRSVCRDSGSRASAAP